MTKPMVQIRWASKIPPSLPGGGWELSTDGGLTWCRATEAEVRRRTNVELAGWV